MSGFGLVLDYLTSRTVDFKQSGGRGTQWALHECLWGT